MIESRRITVSRRAPKLQKIFNHSQDIDLNGNHQNKSKAFGIPCSPYLLYLLLVLSNSPPENYNNWDYYHLPYLEPTPDTGGIEFKGDIEAIYRANLFLRTASRVLLRMGDFHAAAFSELKRHTQALPWKQFISPGQNVSVRVTCHKSRLYHSSCRCS